MLVILLNHLRLYPSFWQYFTGRGDLWISAAEGFFFVSGIMVGLVRGNEYKAKNNLKDLSKKMIGRSAKIYLVFLASCVVSLMLLGLMNILGINYSTATISSIKIKNINDSLWSFINLSSHYGWADFLKYYVVFLLISIPILFLLKIKMWYLVIGLSIFSWIAPRIAIFPFDAYFLYWLFYFLLGITFGYYYEDIRNKFKKISNKTRGHIANTSIAISFVIICLNFFINFYKSPKVINFINIIKSLSLFEWRPTFQTEFYLYNSRTGYFRPLIFIILFMGLFFIFKKFENFINSNLDWLIGEFGRNSLRIYVIGAFYTYIFKVWAKDTTFIYNTIVSSLFIIIILYTSKNALIKKIIPN